MISGVILARNEEANIVGCLESLRPFVEDLTLIDMESTDLTVDLAQPYVRQVLRCPLVPNFDAARNVAIASARHEWLWFLDADERVRPATGHLVRQLIHERGAEITAITIPFQTYFCGQWMQHCGWWPGYTMPRVLKRGHFRFAEELRAGVQFEGQGLRIGPDPALAIEHFSYRDIAHYVEKFNRYTSTEALNLARHGARPDWREGVRAMTRDLWLYYERNDGDRDGLRGWILSWLAGQYRWFAHAKLADLPQFQQELGHCGVPGSLDEVLAVIEGELSRLRGDRRANQHSMVLHSPLFDPSGYAEDGRMLLKAAAHGDRHVTAKEIPWSNTPGELPTADTTLFRALLRGRRQDPSIAVTNCIPGLRGPDSAAAVNVLRTTFETDRIPEHWHAHLNQFDEIWVVSHHNAVAFRRSGVPPEKIRVLPGFVDTALFTPDGPRRDLPSGCDQRFVFLAVFDWQLRKGWDVLLRAYAREFAVTEQTALLLKVTMAHGYTLEQVREQITRLLATEGISWDARPDIILWQEVLSPQQLANLYRSVDAFVLASRGEGWGRPYIEAMASGLTTIGTRGSGNVDFMHDANSLLVDTTVVPVSAEAAAEINVYRGHQWCEPRLDDLRQCLRRAVVEREQLAQLRAQAVRDIRTNFSLDAAQGALERQLAVLDAQRQELTAPPARDDQIRVELEGEFFAGHSFANVNEQLALRLGQVDSIALSLRRLVLNPTYDAVAPAARVIRPFLGRELSGTPQVVIRHAFPPNWQRPAAGKWVHIQPWEFGALPRDWVAPLRDAVDEVWAPSEFVRQVYVRSGIAAAKIQVIPWGVDPLVYAPAAPPLHLPHEGSFRFLYMGGTVERKGFDVLLRAYREEFTAGESVALVIKDVGTQTFYRFGNGREEVRRLIAEGQGPPLVYLEDEMTDGQRASLYTACDCLAAPYRGEGFGLPVLEAMACGLAPIVPRGGATDDFVADDTAYLVPSRTVECYHDWRLCAPATELAIEIADVRAALRQAYEQREETRRKGKRASEFVHREFTWDQAVAKMVCRLHLLTTAASQEVAAPLATVDESPARDAALLAPLDLSVCVLTQNMEASLAECLALGQPWAREIIVHDLGSTDRTLPIAREYAARITIGVDRDHRAAARNTALMRATSEWILSLDGDERLDETEWEQLARILPQVSADVLGLRLHVLDTMSETGQNGWHGEVRLFRNRNGLVFECRGAERVTPAIRRLGGRILEVPLAVRRGPVSELQQGQLRARLHRDLLERGRDAEALWSLGIAHARAGDFFHAESFCHDCLTSVEPTAPLHREALTLLVECYRRTGDEYRAAEFAARLQALPGGVP